MILYQGPSRIDGKPIVVVATIDSENPKTRDMVQVWIFRADINPMEAQRIGADRSICGDCPQRWYLDGSCYVIVVNAPRAVYARYMRGGYSDPENIANVTEALKSRPIRLGAYGDPCAVPYEVWENLLGEGCNRWTGYTHQWKLPENQAYRGILMASVDTVEEAAQAKAMGWRYFLVSHDAPMGDIPCPAYTSDTACDKCTACDGTRGDTRSCGAANIVVLPHGAKQRKWNLNVVR